MQQIEIIHKLSQLFEKQKEIDSLLLIGSFARDSAKAYSDIDLQIILNPNYIDFNPIDLIIEFFGEQIQYSFYLNKKNKIVFYLNQDLILCEVFICRAYEDIDKYFLGSEIDIVSKSILFDKTGKIEVYLNRIRIDYNSKKEENRLVEINTNLIDFLYHFESCSSAHARSDGYKFYVIYNNALNCIVKLIYWANDGMDYSYLPPQFLIRYGHSINFSKHNGSMHLSKGNDIKRELLDRFKYVISILIQKYPIKSNPDTMISFCEQIYDRDYFFNYRDISANNPIIKRGVVYRAATMTPMQDEKRFSDMLENNKIGTIVDLRADREITDNYYSEDIKRKFKYINAQFDPWSQPNWFKEQYNSGTDEEIAYHFFTIGCNEKIKEVIDAIINEHNSTIIHCFTGKDRTGIIVTLLHMLVDTPLEYIYTDYLASGADVKKRLIDIVINTIEEKGGIVPYLLNCGIQQTQIDLLKNKLLNGN